MMKSLPAWFRKGDPWVWLNAAAVTVSILLVVGLLLLIAVRGMAHFWPDPVHEVVYNDPVAGQQLLLGEFRESEEITSQRLAEAGVDVAFEADEVTRILVKTGNRDVLGQDFTWILAPLIQRRSQPDSAVVLERTEWGSFHGYLLAVNQDGESVASGQTPWTTLEQRLQRVGELRDGIEEIESDRIGSINYQLEQLRLERRELELDGELTPAAQARLDAERAELQSQYRALEQKLVDLQQDIRRDSAIMQTASGSRHEILLANVLDAYKPNTYGLTDKLGHFFRKFREFISHYPREANTEGGVFPAIFGTVLMVLLMSVFVTPFGVIAAVYLKEYARQGLLTRTIRVAVNNLAGVPSIVYGVFGLGFFIYFLGGNIDQLFYPEALPSPTFGSGGIFWASLTLALLTLPVVIVSTEEGLSRIPRSVREGSLALGATKAETLWRTVIPMASPGIMTGLILAVARAAGEVAPLMLVGVVKLAPSLPLDGNFPYLHLERKFMHLGFHIYDVGFQSPNVEAARPLVYATALLLVLIIILLNLVAIHVRNNLRERYRSLEH